MRQSAVSGALPNCLLPTAYLVIIVVISRRWAAETTSGADDAGSEAGPQPIHGHFRPCLGAELEIERVMGGIELGRDQAGNADPDQPEQRAVGFALEQRQS